MNRPRRVIQVYPELGNRWPLWEINGPLIDPSPTDLGLSSELEGRLKGWYDFWELHHDWQHGWDSVENEQASWADGSELVAMLRIEVAAFADVSDERYRVPRAW
ncbi:hypothetical protein BH09ACT6_BH09ACT6_12200 [soil metagenome]